MEARTFPHSSDPEPGPSMDKLVREANFFRARKDSEDIEVVGEKPRNIDVGAYVGPVVLFAITAFYVYYEICWQLDLLHLMGTASASRDDVDWMILEGRALASFGLVWALLKTKFLKSTTEMGATIVTGILVAAACLMTFSVIGKGYDSVIDGLPAPTSLQLYKVAAHRLWTLQGELPADVSAKDPVATVLWPLKMADPAQASEIAAVFDRRAEAFQSDIAKKAHELWPGVQSKLSASAAAGGIGALSTKFEEAYMTYIAGSKQTKSLVGSWQSQRTDYFQNLTGIPPNASASKEDFAKALGKAKIAQMQELGRMYIETGGFKKDFIVYQSGDLAFYSSDFANVKSESDFTNVIVKKAGGSLAAQAPTLANVKSQPLANSVVSSAVVPPISMVLSTVSILVNVGALIGLLCLRIPLLRYLQVLIPPVFAAVALIMIPPTTTLPGVGAGMSWLHSNYGAAAWLLERVVTIERFALGLFA